MRWPSPQLAGPQAVANSSRVCCGWDGLNGCPPLQAPGQGRGRLPHLGKRRRRGGQGLSVGGFQLYDSILCLWICESTPMILHIHVEEWRTFAMHRLQVMLSTNGQYQQGSGQPLKYCVLLSQLRFHYYRPHWRLLWIQLQDLSSCGSNVGQRICCLAGVPLWPHLCCTHLSVNKSKYYKCFLSLKCSLLHTHIHSAPWTSHNLGYGKWLCTLHIHCIKFMWKLLTFITLWVISNPLSVCAHIVFLHSPMNSIWYLLIYISLTSQSLDCCM